MKNTNVKITYKIGDSELKTLSFTANNSDEIPNESEILEIIMMHENPDMPSIYPLISDSPIGIRQKIATFNELKINHNITHLQYEIDGVIHSK